MLPKTLLVSAIVTINNLTTVLKQTISNNSFDTIILIYEHQLEEDAEIILKQNSGNKSWLLIDHDTYNDSFVFINDIAKFYMNDKYFIITLLMQIENFKNFIT